MRTPAVRYHAARMVALFPECLISQRRELKRSAVVDTGVDLDVGTHCDPYYSQPHIRYLGIVFVKDTLLCLVVGVSNGEVMIDLNMKRSPMCLSLLPADGPISSRLRSACGRARISMNTGSSSSRTSTWYATQCTASVPDGVTSLRYHQLSLHSIFLNQADPCCTENFLRLG